MNRMSSSILWSSLQHAAELVKTVASRYDEYVSVKDLTDKINRALTAAKKDNDFIYHDRVPEVKDLEHIGKAALVRATAITPPLSQKFTGEQHRHSTQSLIVKKVWHKKNSTSEHPCQTTSLKLKIGHFGGIHLLVKIWLSLVVVWQHYGENLICCLWLKTIQHILAYRWYWLPYKV